MQAVQSTEPAQIVRRDSIVRFLALVGLICSPALLVAWFQGGFDNPTPSRSVVVLQLLFLVGWFSSVLAMLRVSATGQGSARHLLWVQLGGVALASTQELQDLLIPVPDRAGVFYGAADAAWPLSVVFMVVIGVAVARARILTGWHRFAAIFCGLSLPLSLVTAAVAGGRAMGPAFGIMTTVAWGGLAWALLSNAAGAVVLRR